MNFSSAIRDWKFYHKYIYPNQPFHEQVSKIVDIAEYTNRTGVVEDELNTDKIIDDHILTNRRLMVRGVYAGSGKSYIYIYMYVSIYNTEVIKSCL